MKSFLNRLVGIRGKRISDINQPVVEGKSGKSSLGLLTLVCLVVGNMIGVGLYVGSYYSMMSLKDARLILIVWLVGGLHAMCGAIAYGAVASRLPVSGGEYSYLTRCVHPAVGFIAGWISIIAGFTAPIAASGLLIGKYVVQYGFDPWYVRWIAAGSVLFAALLHACHLKVGASFNNGVIALKFLCFGVFLVYGIPYVLQTSNTGLLTASEGAINPSTQLSVRLTESETIIQMIVSLFYVALAYTGFNASIYIAGEIDDPGDGGEPGRGIVRRSMILASVLVTVIYIVLNYVFLYGMSAQDIVSSGEGFVTVVAGHISGSFLENLIRLAIILSAGTSVLAMMAIGPMVYAQMAEDGRLPRLFRVAGGAPRIAIAVQLILSCIVIWYSNILDIVKYLGLTLTACGALAVSSIWFAKRQMAIASPVRWYEHVATGLYVGGALLFLFVAYLQEPLQFWLCMGTFATGLLVYGFSVWFKRD